MPCLDSQRLVELVVELAHLAGREVLGLVFVAVAHVQPVAICVRAVGLLVVVGRLPPAVAQENRVLALVPGGYGGWLHVVCVRACVRACLCLCNLMRHYDIMTHKSSNTLLES